MLASLVIAALQGRAEPLDAIQTDPPEFVRLEGHFVDERGASLRPEFVTWDLVGLLDGRTVAVGGLGGFGQHSGLRVDARGHFVTEPLLRVPTRCEHIELRFRVAQLGGAVVPLPTDLRVGSSGGPVLELGDVALGPAPLTTSAVLLDHSGAPLAGQLVLFSERGSEGLPFARTDAEGRFEVRHFPSIDGAPLSVSLPAEEGVRTAHRWELVPGQSGQVVRAPAPTTVTVELQPVEGWVAPDYFFVCLLDERGRVVASAGHQGESALSLAVDETGPFELWVESWGSRDVFRVLRGVELEAGVDNRLPPIRIGAGLRSIRARVHDAEGNPIRHAEARTHRHVFNGDWVLPAWTDSGGQVELTLCAEVDRLRFTAKGFWGRWAPIVGDECAVQLDRGGSAELVFPESWESIVADELGSSYFWPQGLWLSTASTDPSWDRGHLTFKPESQSSRGTLDTPGRHQITPFGPLRSGVEPFTIDVPAGEEPFRIELSENDLRRICGG
ncbi:hypothetical protein [Engelhardtia mirabilis]|uniref:Uncharacterized protein n=1 Tax=Engelhardtia mirabilis TaxID=2528011 RepID=A0A518BRX9_9BACT|nr:hypothetical protein Pla133_48490 [Planctomycetes bacterium Pla133]QDV04053.1 hypothetical protein Pla86_48470 [Planctomycetes bacterium Pla86]